MCLLGQGKSNAKSASEAPPTKRCGGENRDAVREERSWFWKGGECHLAGRVKPRQIPRVGAGDGESARGAYAGPVEEIERAADLRGEIHIIGEGEVQRAGECDRDAERE